jgi:NADPH2:quinone reductase
MPLAGMEASASSDAAGEGVTHLQPGDRAAYASQPLAKIAKCAGRVVLPDAISSRDRRP